jgi:hypothetical protein
MTPEERLQLVDAYVSHHTRRDVSEPDMVLRKVRDGDNFWAFEKMEELSHRDPDLCWELIIQVLHTPHENSVTEVLAAGPLEDLLAKFGAQVIDRVEKAALEDPLFKALLAGVWQNSIQPQVWARVEACRGEPW